MAQDLAASHKDKTDAIGQSRIGSHFIMKSYFFNISIRHWLKNDLVRMNEILGGSDYKHDTKDDLLRSINQLFREKEGTHEHEAVMNQIQPLAAYKREEMAEARRKNKEGFNSRSRLRSLLGDVECQVCTETIGHVGVPCKTLITKTCDHNAEICMPCLQTNISTQLESKNWDVLVCPHPGCNGRLDYQDVITHANQTTKDRYEEHLLQQALESEDSYHRCAHEGCSSGGFANPKTDSFLVCVKCVRKTCI